jgi:hypothetical protein
MATPSERRRAQRQLARQMREIRAGRATYERSSAGRAYERAIERIRRERPIIGDKAIGGSLDDLREQVRNRFLDIFGSDVPTGSRYESNIQRFTRALDHIYDRDQLIRMLNASESEWTSMARFQSEDQARGAGYDPQDIGWYDARGNWHNIFWYR